MCCGFECVVDSHVLFTHVTVFFVTDVGKYVLYGLLGQPQYVAVVGIVNAMRQLLRHKDNEKEFAEFFPTLVESLSDFEKTAPETEHV